jgi:hypothetical protein
MKNIHLLPTDKPSRVFITKDEGLGFDNQMLENTELDCQNQNIYITSDEEIKEGDWFIANNGVHKCIRVDNNTSCPFITLNSKGEEIGHFKTWRTKIILTTDQDLIKEGVQAIDDEFLEYYVSVPFGEIKEVEVDDLREISNEFIELDTMPYKIIIPKEEPKQHVELINDNIEEFDKAMELFKQETTLEEAAERISPIQQVINFITENFQKEGEARQLSMDLLKKWCEVKLLNEESKWNQERSYSEEEVKEILTKCTWILTESKLKWFEQFKKK